MAMMKLRTASRFAPWNYVSRATVSFSARAAKDDTGSLHDAQGSSNTERQIGVLQRLFVKKDERMGAMLRTLRQFLKLDESVMVFAIGQAIPRAIRMVAMLHRDGIIQAPSVRVDFVPKRSTENTKAEENSDEQRKSLGTERVVITVTRSADFFDKQREWELRAFDVLRQRAEPAD
ncbi:hypothetical protein FVE85_0469 [Porphyridium purpureum]|uniref:DNA/RNA-binding protein Alba-like domain-containing protein n=1 Tax=Porphyridium purpureum TaxID=35688 RepID=A0A5J4Z0E2_PORPP|nr:hypothetical protein FVE85_0469 [Porphyridium purpureum]|eukprot:POR6821..scf208_2